MGKWLERFNAELEKASSPLEDCLEIKTKQYQTINYDLFKLCVGNRDLNQDHIKKVAAALEKTNKLHVYPVVVSEIGDGHLAIRDGQHRFMACRMLKIPVVFIVDNEYSDEDMMIINACLRKWNSNDYVNHYSSLGNEHYERLKDDALTFKRDSSRIMWVFNKKKGIDTGELSYTRADSALVHKVFTEMDLFKDFPFYKERNFTRAYVVLRQKEGFHLATIKSQLQKWPIKLHKCAKVGEYYKLLLDFYNYHRSKTRLVMSEKDLRIISGGN